MPGKIFALECCLPAVRHGPTLVEIRTEVCNILIDDSAAEAIRRLAYLFFRSELSDRSIQMKRTMLRLVWGHIERRIAQYAEDVVDDALDLVETAVTAELMDGIAQAPAQAMKVARVDLNEEWKRARLIGRASALIDLICNGEHELSESMLLGLANRLS
jgi:hypothetical protein